MSKTEIIVHSAVLKMIHKNPEISKEILINLIELGRIENDGWITAAINASDENRLAIAREFFLADILESD